MTPSFPFIEWLKLVRAHQWREPMGWHIWSHLGRERPEEPVGSWDCPSWRGESSSGGSFQKCDPKVGLDSSISDTAGLLPNFMSTCSPQASLLSTTWTKSELTPCGCCRGAVGSEGCRAHAELLWPWGHKVGCAGTCRRGSSERISEDQDGDV